MNATVNDTTEKKKKRRRRTSKCTPTSISDFRKAPFKDTADNSICVDDCLGTRLGHVLTKTTSKKTEPHEMVTNIMEQDVGVRGLISEDVKKTIDWTPLILEIKLLIKNNNKLHLYISLSLKQAKSVFPNEDCSETFPKKVVFHMLYFILSHVVPRSLFGSKHNFTVFMNSVKRIVYGYRHQKLSLSSVVHGLKVSHIIWLQKNLPSHCIRLFVLACVVKWLILYVQTLIPKIWHLALHSCKDIIYYNKGKWEKMKKCAIETQIGDKKIEKVVEGSDVDKKIRATGRTSFLVKKSGLRPITVFRKSEDCNEERLLKNARMLLTQLAHFNGSINTPFNQSFEKSLHDGLVQIANNSRSCADRPQYYFVKADVADAFGSIKHSLLNAKLLRLFAVSGVKGPSCRTRHVYNKRDVIVTMFETSEMAIPQTMRKHRSLPGESVKDVLKLIQDYIMNLATILDGCKYKFCSGIPQGMQLSPILCELYYNFLDLHHLREFKKTEPGELFLRYCDDYLFITPSKERAERFMLKVNQGFPDFHVYFNREKTLTNLAKCKNVKVIPFYGLKINVETFSVEGNFDSYENLRTACTISLACTKSLGKVLFQRMFIVLKLSPILLDKGLNTKHVAMKNIFQAALLMACRFSSFVNTCFPPGKLNEKFALRCIKKGNTFIRRRVYKALKRSSVPAANWISSDEIKFIVFKAFAVRILRGSGPHQYKWLLRYLKKTANCLLLRNLDKLELLQNVSWPTHVFTTLK